MFLIMKLIFKRFHITAEVYAVFGVEQLFIQLGRLHGQIDGTRFDFLTQSLSALRPPLTINLLASKLQRLQVV